jgi:hypothetical protein
MIPSIVNPARNDVPPSMPQCSKNGRPACSIPAAACVTAQLVSTLLAADATRRQSRRGETHRGPDEVVRGEDGGTIFGIRKYDVKEKALERNEVRSPVYRYRDQAPNPVYTLTRSPREDPATHTRGAVSPQGLIAVPSPYRLTTTRPRRRMQRGQRSRGASR